MANRKISDLTSLTAPATGDLLPIVDISEAAAADKNKKITYAELLASAPAGSAAAPSFSFDADPNTGLFNPAADTLAFAEGGAEAMRIDSSGRVGIGSTLSGNANNRLLIRSESASAITDVLLLNNGAANNNAGQGVRLNLSGISETNSDIRYAYIEAATQTTGNDHYLAFGTNSAGVTPVERVRIDNSGRLLVGTATANTSGAKLQTSDGLTFPATAVASADPNTLDDYEEGTWTPTQEANLTVVGTFSSTGRYLKVGRQVFAEGVVTGSTSVAVLTTNAIAIGGLPFTPGYSRTPGLAGNEAISASATFQLVGTTLYFMQTMAATTNIRFVVTYSV